jgi:NAD+ diphosphatase
LDRNQRGDLPARWARALVFEVAPGPMVDSTALKPPGEFDPASCYYLGEWIDGDSRQPIFARWVAQAENDLRNVMEPISAVQAQPLFAACALVNWHSSARFCPACGGETVVSGEGWSRDCQGCGRELFPRTDPAVIVAIRDPDDRLLLGRQPIWGRRRMSVFAGFVEAGESAEQAVHREVAEEVGLALDGVGYFGSQPWPFPRSLMLGFTARARDPEIELGDEIESARWFTRKEFTWALESGEVRAPSVHSIARRMIQAWLDDGR